MMKTISIMIPTYNEEENVELLYEAIKEEFKKNLKNYKYEILFIDNKSKDNTRLKLKKICEKDKGVKAIFNAHNFGQFNSPYYGILQTTGDCTVTMCADFQDPVEMIHKFVKEWENGYKIVIGIKSKSKENKIMRFFRTCYYKLIKKFSDVEQIEHFTGFGLYDKDFVQVLRDLKDPEPYMRGIVAELGYERKELEYVQPKRLHGKSSNNFMRLYDAAMVGITSYTKKEMHLITIFGFIVSLFSFILAIVYLVLKLINWNSFNAGMAPMLIGMFFLGGIIIFLLGFMGEFISIMNQRIMNRPLVIEEERINFDEKA